MTSEKSGKLDLVGTQLIGQLSNNKRNRPSENSNQE